MMNYSEKKYGRNIISQRILPEKKKKKTVKLKVKTLCILLIMFLIIGIIIGYAFTHIHQRLVNVQCINTLKGGGYNG